MAAPAEEVIFSPIRAGDQLCAQQYSLVTGNGFVFLLSLVCKVI